MSEYEICQVPTYKEFVYEFNPIKPYLKIAKKTIKPIDTINAILLNDLQLHERLNENDLLKLSVDIDKLTEKNKNATLETVFHDICEYVGVTMNDISYTTNFSVESGSHHIVIPKYYMISSNQKIYWKEFREKYGYGKEIDADIFGKNCWFRLPNQTKEGKEGTEHIIQKGEIKDFVLKYIENAIEYPLKQKTNTIKFEVKKEDVTTDEDEVSDITVEANLPNNLESDIEYLLMECIKDNECKKGDHSDWINIGQAIKNELKDEGVILFVEWTKKFGTSNKKQEAYTHYTKHLKYTPLKDKKRVSIGTIKYLAKKHNETAYNLRFKTQTIKFNNYDSDIMDMIFEAGDYDYAKYFVKKWGTNFVCTNIRNKTFVEFTKDKMWKENEGGSNIRNMISNEMYDEFSKLQHQMLEEAKQYDPASEEHEKCNRTIKKIAEICMRFKKTNDKNNILREIQDLIINEQFLDDMNKVKDILPIKNGKILNVKTLEVSERTIQHKFNYECNATYLQITEEEEADINQYFLDLFCQKQDLVDCVIDILKSIFSGEKLRYIFFFTGSGCNGKSLLFKILQEIFKKSMNTIATNVILDLKQNNTITTEYEKLDKCLLGYVTELKDTDKLNEKVIKQISGGDPIDLRALFKTNVTINPTCNLCVLTNELPTFKKEKAIVDRIITIPFLNTFEVDSSFEAKMMVKKDQIFSYIMKRGKILDKLNLTEDMIASKEEYVENNEASDYLKDFIEENYDVVEYDNTEKTRVNRDDFRVAFNNWCKSKDFGIDKSDHTKFTKNMNKKFNINTKQIGKKKVCYYIGISYKNEEIDESE